MFDIVRLFQSILLSPQNIELDSRSCRIVLDTTLCDKDWQWF